MWKSARRRSELAPPRAAERHRRTFACPLRAAAAVSSRPAEGRDRRYWAFVNPESLADRPKLQRQPRELARDVHRDAPRGLELLPQIVGLIELEICESCVVRDLSRGDGHCVHWHARKLQPHEIADLLGGTDFELCREPTP